MRKLALVRFAVRIGPRPRIGVTADPGYDVGEYEAAIRQAGGEPVRWMPDVTRIDADLRNVDGIILSGGEDIDPARYGQALHPQAELASAARDEYEIALARAAYGRGIPTLAICRGLQIANVAFGGSLHQHLPDAFGADVPHAPQVDGATYRGLIDEHRVTVAEGSLLAKIVVGRAPDGVVEALEAPAAKAFWLAVQWHPESTTALDAGASAALFAALVASARPYTDRSSG
jgi:putative glutamine amidotransferase